MRRVIGPEAWAHLVWCPLTWTFPPHHYLFRAGTSLAAAVALAPPDHPAGPRPPHDPQHHAKPGPGHDPGKAAATINGPVERLLPNSAPPWRGEDRG